MQDTYNQLTNNRKRLLDLISKLKKVGDKLAKAEYEYKIKLTLTCFKLKQQGYCGEINGEHVEVEPTAWTVTTTLARGIPEVADARLERDTLEGEKEAIMQDIYRVKLELGILEKEMEAIRKGD